ncbi:thioredoxin domain-containing protein 11 [Neocloeon triangulifer]|uniref:thioredoxin domain-containing protein 11 n=1 Tax=Neocloeon triangulifer TaxID=2078957 RepID=UPI00286EF631|nr:thioredoxin domain-containing protein 11 [Neocloeon triangulifer]
MSSTVDDTTTDNAESSVPEKPKRGSETYTNCANMFFYVREICFFLTIAVTSYAAIHNAPKLVSQILPATPFFGQNSHIIDFYNGELSPAFEKISESDLTFVMYYAPWDAESQIVKAEFDLLASYYSDEINFIAVNCWHPVGECRRQFNKVQHFPVLIAYPSLRSKGIQYRGIKKASHMARFLKVALRPLTRVDATPDLLDLMAKYDAVIVSCVDMSNSRSGYQTVYLSSLMALERDPFQEVAFGVVTNPKTCVELGFEKEDLTLPCAKLYLWNETLDYEGDWLSENLVKWVSSNIHQAAVWVTLPGSKSMTLAPYVEEGPALLMFTPRNPFFSTTPYFNLLREIGIEYYNCNKNSIVSYLSQHLAAERTASKQKHRNQEKSCFTSVSKGDNYCPMTTKAPTCATVTLPAAINFTISSKMLREKTERLKWETSCEDANVRLNTKLWKAENCLVPSTPEVVLPPNRNTTSITIDPRTLSLGKIKRDQRCKRLLLGRRLHVPVYPKRSQEKFDFSQLQGLSCTNNRSLSLLALDSLEFGEFAKHVGVDTSQMLDKTAVVIVDGASETSNLLIGPITKVTLTEFLVNHTANSLQRSKRTFERDEYKKLCPSGSFCVPELNTTNFLASVLKESEDVAVLYHSPLCGMCGSASLAFLTVARLFQGTSNLRFVRIDGENNDLPWQYSMESYPTILFFPAFGKSESRVFSRRQPITVETLTHFVLANLRTDSRLHSLLSLHGSKKQARLHTLTALRSLSSQYRLQRQQKNCSAFLPWRRFKQRSQYLRLLHLALNNSCLEEEATASLNRYYHLSPHTSTRSFKQYSIRHLRQ